MHNLIEWIYFLLWTSACITAILLVIIDPKPYEPLKSSYWRAHLHGWKLATFAVATFLITVVAPYSGDPTWDYFDSIGISLNVFLVAPWSVAVIYRSFKQRVNKKYLFVAVCAFLSPCWAYDLYILIRDGEYPVAWFPNIGITVAITASAGLFWSLAWDEKLGIHYDFTTETWPQSKRSPLKKLFLPALILALPVLLAITWFVWTTNFSSR